jgi:hypothetical protein
MGFFDNFKSDNFENILRKFAGLDPKDPPPQRVEDIVQELQTLTTDDTDEEVILRSLVNYLSIVRHVKAGGTVKFLGPGVTVKTLKVRLRT